MDASDAIQVLILIFLIACSAFFSSSETAMTTVSKIRVRNLAEGGDRRAILLSRLIEEPGKMLSAILIGNNIVNISASSLATILVTHWLGSAGAGISTGALTLIVLVFGEVTPKTCATIDPEKQSLRSAQIIYIWTQIAIPLIFIVNHLAMGLMFLMRVDPQARNDSYTEEDIRSIVDVSHEDGVIEQEEKEMYTTVLKGHIQLEMARFLQGCSGQSLDVLARTPLWEKGLDYNHGTGHGVGYLLSVHEGPNSFRYRPSVNGRNDCVFEEGMITSDEPGIYLEGKFGIRLENMIVCQKDMENDYGSFLCFDALTLVPFERSAIIAEELSTKEKEWLNKYHQKVFETIAPYLTEEEAGWLREETQEF